MTATQEQAASVNGTAPAADPGEDAGPVIDMSERVMGLIGIACAVGLLLVGIDLLTGGALARLVVRPGQGGDGDE